MDPWLARWHRNSERTLMVSIELDCHGLFWKRISLHFCCSLATNAYRFTDLLCHWMTNKRAGQSEQRLGIIAWLYVGPMADYRLLECPVNSYISETNARLKGRPLPGSENSLRSDLCPSYRIVWSINPVLICKPTIILGARSNGLLQQWIYCLWSKQIYKML